MGSGHGAGRPFGCPGSDHTGDLRDVPLILAAPAGWQSELARWFGAEFEKLNILFTSNLPSNSSVMVHHKLAYSLVILGSLSFWDPKKITYRPLYPEVRATSVLAWKRKQPFGLAAEKFIAYAKETLQEEKSCPTSILFHESKH